MTYTDYTGPTLPGIDDLATPWDIEDGLAQRKRAGCSDDTVCSSCGRHRECQDKIFNANHKRR